MLSQSLNGLHHPNTQHTYFDFSSVNKIQPNKENSSIPIIYFQMIGKGVYYYFLEIKEREKENNRHNSFDLCLDEFEVMEKNDHNQ